MTTSLKQVRHGFVLGKFMPLHHGHMHLLHVAAEMSDHLTILVCSLPSEPIDGVLRASWVREMFPAATVIHLATPMPQEPSEHKDFWAIWRQTIRRLVESSIDGVFASEVYGWRLAQELGASFIPVDRQRSMMPVSGTAVRADPYKNWHYLPAPVRAYYAKRVAILGPESVGKSTLTKRLSTHFSTIGVEEYARQFFDEQLAAGKSARGEFKYDDLSVVARGQNALEQSLVRYANRVLITDTDMLTTLTWSQYLYGRYEPWLYEAAHAQSYDLTLLLRPESTKFVQDGQRVMVDDSTRVRFVDMLEANLQAAKRPYLVLRGDYEPRFAKAVQAVEALFT